MKIDSAEQAKNAQCKRFYPTIGGSAECRCGHNLYSHYMCGSPQESYCMICKPVPEAVPVGISEPKPEICGNSNHGWKARMTCVLPKGHEGNHEYSCRCWWRISRGIPIIDQADCLAKGYEFYKRQLLAAQSRITQLTAEKEEAERELALRSDTACQHYAAWKAAEATLAQIRTIVNTPEAGGWAVMKIREVLEGK